MMQFSLNIKSWNETSSFNSLELH